MLISFRCKYIRMPLHATSKQYCTDSIAFIVPTNACPHSNNVLFDAHAVEELRHIYIQSTKLHQHSKMNRDHIHSPHLTFSSLSP